MCERTQCPTAASDNTAGTESTSIRFTKACATLTGRFRLEPVLPAGQLPQRGQADEHGPQAGQAQAHTKSRDGQRVAQRFAVMVDATSSNSRKTGLARALFLGLQKVLGRNPACASRSRGK